MSLEQAVDKLSEAALGAALMAKAFAESTGDAGMIEKANALVENANPKRRQDD
jgi:hypothetical protein